MFEAILLPGLPAPALGRIGFWRRRRSWARPHYHESFYWYSYSHYSWYYYYYYYYHYYYYHYYYYYYYDCYCHWRCAAPGPGGPRQLPPLTSSYTVGRETYLEFEEWFGTRQQEVAAFFRTKILHVYGFLSIGIWFLRGEFFPKYRQSLRKSTWDSEHLVRQPMLWGTQARAFHDRALDDIYATKLDMSKQNPIRTYALSSNNKTPACIAPICVRQRRSIYMYMHLYVFNIYIYIYMILYVILTL